MIDVRTSHEFDIRLTNDSSRRTVDLYRAYSPGQFFSLFVT